MNRVCSPREKTVQAMVKEEDRYESESVADLQSVEDAESTRESRVLPPVRNSFAVFVIWRLVVVISSTLRES